MLLPVVNGRANIKILGGPIDTCQGVILKKVISTLYSEMDFFGITQSFGKTWRRDFFGVGLGFFVLLWHNFCLSYAHPLSILDNYYEMDVFCVFEKNCLQAINSKQCSLPYIGWSSIYMCILIYHVLCQKELRLLIRKEVSCFYSFLIMNVMGM